MTDTLPFPSPVETLRQKARRWILTHPKEVAVFVRLAENRRVHNKRFGMKALFEVARWEAPTYGLDEDGFKINNSFAPYVARWLARNDPRIAPLIKTRVTPAADRPARNPQRSQRVDPLTDEPIDDDDGSST